MDTPRPLTNQILLKPEFPISTLSLCGNHTPAALARQVQIDIAALGSHRDSFGSFADLVGLFLPSNLSGPDTCPDWTTSERPIRCLSWFATRPAPAAPRS